MARIRMLALCAAMGGAFMVSSGRTASEAGQAPIEQRHNLTTQLFQSDGKEHDLDLR